MGIKIFEKNKIDLDFNNPVITVTDAIATDPGTDFLSYMRNRRNDSGWGTAGSTDAANTQIDVDLLDSHVLTDIILVRHNFKSYTIKYWDGATYVDFSTPIAVTLNATTTTSHHFNSVTTSKIRLIITGTMTADDDKLLAQFIITKLIGEFTGQPKITKPKQEKGRKVRPMLSGRKNVTRSIGTFSCALNFPVSKSDADMTIINTMYESYNGFLVWLCGGSVSQFSVADVRGFRLSDIYLMTRSNDLETEWFGGHFDHGQKMDINLVESRI